MSPKWESSSVAKIHENCGGLVRWVEAYDDPHIGYTGECLECGREGIVVEAIIPVECPDGAIATDVFNEADLATLRDLEWHDAEDYETNQTRLQQQVVE